MTKKYAKVNANYEEDTKFVIGKTYVRENQKFVIFDGDFKCAKEETAVKRIWNAIREYMKNETVGESVKAIFDNWNDFEYILGNGDTDQSLLPEMCKKQFFEDYSIKIDSEFIDGFGYYVEVVFAK